MSDDILKEAQDAFDTIAEHESDNRKEYEDDIDFALLENQWPEQIRRDRELEGRPCLTINRLPPLIRQVVNDARQNKPGITVHPVDDNSDPETAEVFNGLIRNIEQSSNAEVAYDTALECAVAGGFGYFRINTAYSSDDTFDQDLVIERVANPLSVYGDCYSTAADSSDWNTAFVVDTLTTRQFEAKFKGAQRVNWNGDDWHDVAAPWKDGDNVMVAEYWKREEVTRKILLLSDGQIIGLKEYEAQKALFDALGVVPQGQTRDVRSHKVTQYQLSGAEVLETVEWAGRYIPIVPVYGVEVNLKGKRYFRSLIRSAKDEQRRFNFNTTAATELVALAPKAPYIGRKGTFNTDAAKWATANNQSHPFIEYDGADPPQRQPFAGVPVGELQMALTASDNIKAVVGLYDASLGAKSNETSGRAIMARQREGDVSTFHFIDNLSRAIRHAGRILIDLIPQVYGVPRVVRVLGEDGKPRMAPVNQEFTAQEQGEDGQVQEIRKIYDLTAGKYDLTVKAGPSFASQREEFVDAAGTLIQAFPAIGPALAPLVIESFDIPRADEVLEAIKSLTGENPQMEQAKQVVQELGGKLQETMQQMQALQAENDQLKAANEIKARELEVKAFEAETKRIEAMKPEPLPRAANSQA